MTLSRLTTFVVAIGLSFGLALAGAEAASLSPPYDVAAHPTSSSTLTITWSDSNPDVTGFVIQRSVKPENGFKTIVTTSAAARSYLDAGLTTGETYYYRLRTKLNGTVSTLSDTVGVTVVAGDAVAPPVPTGLRTGTITCGRVDVFWTPVTDSGGSGLRGYRVYRNNVYLREVLAPSASTTDLTVAASASYSYGVSALDNAGNESARVMVSATTPACGGGATVTPTATRTATRTPTPVATVTRTPTRTATPMRTATPTRTATAASTATRTATPVPTATRTATPVRTATPTPTPPPTFDPLLIGFVPGVGSAQDVSVVGTTAFVASDPFGLSAVDAATPSLPVVDGTPLQSFAGARSAVRGTRAVVTGAAGGVARLWVLDVSAPQPAVLGELATTASSVLDVAMNDAGTLAVMAMGATGVWVVDLANPAAPVRRSIFDTAGVAFAVALNGTGSLAYVADGTGGLKVLSLANPSAPTQVGALALSGIQRDIAVQSNVVYLADQTGRLLTADVATPSAPRQLGALVIGRYTFHLAVEGTRAVLHSADSVSYLDVIDVTSLTAPVVLGSVAVDAAGGIKGVAIAGGRAYVANGDLGLKIYSVGSVPTLSGGMNDPFSATRIAMAGGRSVVTGAHLPTASARLRVLDTTDPTVPEVLGELPTTVTAAGILDVAMNGSGTLAVTAMGTAGIWVVDLANPSAPVRRGVYDTSGVAFAVALNASGSLAYVADGSGGLKVVSLANPSAPSQVGSIALSGIQRDVAVQGSVAYVVDQMGRLVTVDVANASAPQQLGALTMGRYAYNVAVSGTLAIMHTQGSAAYLDVVDVTTPASPVIRSSVAVDASGAVKGIALGASRAYVASGTAGLRIYELTNPAAPTLLGSGYTVGDATDVVLGGALAQAADSAAIISIIDLFAP